MKLFFDTEFTGLTQGTTLISLGIVSERGDAFYAEFTDYNRESVNDWIQNNVINNLKYPNRARLYRTRYINNHIEVNVVGHTQFVRYQLLEFLDLLNEDGRTSFELCSDVCHYDMVLFAELFGGAMDIPSNITPCCHDINQDISRYYNINMMQAFNKNREDIVREFNPNSELLHNQEKHNSLYDAKIIKEIYNIVSR